MRYSRQPRRAGQRCADMVRDLAIPVPFDLREFGACLERHTHRTVELVPAILAPGAPSGIFFRTTGAGYLYYEQQTTPYHQAHIVLFLAAHMLLGEVDGASFDRRLVPDVSPQLLRLMLGDIADSTVTRADAEEFAFLALDRARLAACPSFLARRALSAESAVVMTSRVSFLEDSPQVQRLMDGTSFMSEKLIQQLHVQGVDPLRVPRFSVLRLHDDDSGGSLLGAHLAGDLAPSGEAAPAEAGSAGSLAGPGSLGDLDDLLWRHITQVTEPELVVDFFGLAFLRGVTTFTLVELVNELGLAVFEGGRVGLGGSG